MNAATAERHITRDDIEAKFRDIAGEVGEVERSVRPYLIAAAGVTVVAVVGVAYLLGRRKGKRTTTLVEVRRL
jgi:hypothetical protein